MTLASPDSRVTQEDEMMINLLEYDITRPKEEVADILGLSVEEFKTRFSKLLRSRWVVPYVMIDLFALPIIGMEERLITYVFLSGDIKKLDRIIQRLSSPEFSEVNLIWRLFAGRYDVLIRGFPLKSRLDDFVQSIEMIPGVFSTNLSLCTGRYKFRGYNLPRLERGRIRDLTVLDQPENYRSLINVLQEDPLRYAVAPYKETALRLNEKYGLSVDSADIKEQINTLVNRGVIKKIGLRKTKTYWEARGFKRRIFVCFYTHPLAQERIGTLLSRMENVNDVFDVAGAFDILAGVWTHSFHQWGNQLEHLLSIEGLRMSESFMAVDLAISRILNIERL
ncbi:MAG: hypothetical protein ACFFCZ_05660 [Promethearchaeota archaeon]